MISKIVISSRFQFSDLAFESYRSMMLWRLHIAKRTILDIFLSPFFPAVSISEALLREYASHTYVTSVLNGTASISKAQGRILKNFWAWIMIASALTLLILLWNIRPLIVDIYLLAEWSEMVIIVLFQYGVKSFCSHAASGWYGLTFSHYWSFFKHFFEDIWKVGIRWSIIVWD